MRALVVLASITSRVKKVRNHFDGMKTNKLIERTALEEQVSVCCWIMIDLNMTSCDCQSFKGRNLPTVTESPRIIHYVPSLL